jgi:hypothetical protein
MRFEDTHDGWEKQLNSLKQNRGIMAFLDAISREPLLVVANDRENVAADAKAGNCHINVAKRIATTGGTQSFGWYIQFDKMHQATELDGIITACYHSNWITPNGSMVNITPDEHSFHLFLPDAKRSVDVSKGVFFNNRMAFLNEFKCSPGMKQPPRNVTLFTNRGHYSRDKCFERYEIVATSEEALHRVPEHMKITRNGRARLTEDGEQYVTLKFNASLGDQG